MELTPRHAGIVALLAPLPAVTFGATGNPLADVVMAVNILLISATIHLLMSPTEGRHGYDGDADLETDAEHAA